MSSIHDFAALPFLALYAETHFRFFSGFPSFLFARRPEVVFDVPRRLGPGRTDLPVFLIVNDLRRFPSDLSGCAVVVSQENMRPKRFDFNDLTHCEVSHPLSADMPGTGKPDKDKPFTDLPFTDLPFTDLRAFILPVPRGELPSGRVFINACVTITTHRDNKRHIVFNDNLRTSTKRAFSCTIADSDLPGGGSCVFGDLHVHSNYSQSHVEFGPPPAIIDAAAHASGLSFVAITDHSYDLACSTDDYLVIDHELTKWHLYRREIGGGNFRTLLIPGEEVSCLNDKNEVVHLCGIGISDYLPGTLDGARKSRAKERQLSIKEAVGEIHRQGGVAFAAHPGATAGFLSRLLLSRGVWTRTDLATSGIDGMQILNSGFSRPWRRGKTLWIDMLQKGHRVPLLAGNDAHGDFNCYRAVKVPFISISDSPDRYMGHGKTGIYGAPTSIDQIIRAIKNGETFVTTGPFAGISASASPADSIVSHKPVSRSIAGVFVNAGSSPEFGPLRKIVCFAGVAQNPVEQIVLTRAFDGSLFSACEKIIPADLPFKPAYIRVEVTCAGTDAVPAAAQAFTSAVYFGE